MITEREAAGGGQSGSVSAGERRGVVDCASATASWCMVSALVCRAVIQYWVLVCCMHSCPYTGSSFS